MIAPEKISLVISTYNHVRPLELCLAGFRKQTTPPKEIIIADDGSTTATRDLIARLAPSIPCPVRHLWHEDLGFRKNVILNRALSTALGDYLVLTDADCIPHSKFIADHASLAEKGFWVQGRRSYLSSTFSDTLLSTDSIHPLPLFLSGQLSGVAKAFRLPLPIIRRNQEQRGIIGCNMAMWRDDLLKINGWDEEYEGWGLGEDSDVGSRLYHLGRPRKFVYGRAILYHLHHPILGRDHLPKSKTRLEETLRTKKIRCTRGVDSARK